MILFIIALVITAISIAIQARSPVCSLLETLLAISAIVGGFVVFTMVACIIVANVGINTRIEKKRIEYNSLCERYEIVTSEYEDVSRSDVIKDIAEWNVEVYNYKYWAYNPWTNWFYSRRVADEMKMIDTRRQ